MIHGVGIDIVDVRRIERAILRWGERFVRRVYTPEEINYCRRKANPYDSYTVRFAAKEAFIKALRPDGPLPFADIGVVNGKAGRPEIRLSGKALRVFEESLRDGSIHVSLSHDSGCGVACVVIEERAP